MEAGGGEGRAPEAATDHLALREPLALQDSDLEQLSCRCSRAQAFPPRVSLQHPLLAKPVLPIGKGNILKAQLHFHRAGKKVEFGAPSQ